MKDLFIEINNKRNKLKEYNPKAPYKINTKNVLVECLKNIEDKTTDMISTPTIFRKIYNSNYAYVRRKLRKELNSGDTDHVEAII